MQLIGIHYMPLGPLVTRLVKAGVQSVGTRFVEITGWVLLAAWWVGLAVWLWVNFSGFATIP